MPSEPTRRWQELDARHHLHPFTTHHELAAKALDFSPASVRDRLAAGCHDMEQALALLARQAPTREPLLYLRPDSVAEDAGWTSTSSGSRATSSSPRGTGTPR